MSASLNKLFEKPEEEQPKEINSHNAKYVQSKTNHKRDNQINEQINFDKENTSKSENSNYKSFSINKELVIKNNSKIQIKSKPIIHIPLDIIRAEQQNDDEQAKGDNDLEEEKDIQNNPYKVIINEYKLIKKEKKIDKFGNNEIQLNSKQIDYNRNYNKISNEKQNDDKKSKSTEEKENLIIEKENFENENSDKKNNDIIDKSSYYCYNNEIPKYNISEKDIQYKNNLNIKNNNSKKNNNSNLISSISIGLSTKQNNNYNNNNYYRNNCINVNNQNLTKIFEQKNTFQQLKEIELYAVSHSQNINKLYIDNIINNSYYNYENQNPLLNNYKHNNNILDINDINQFKNINNEKYTITLKSKTEDPDIGQISKIQATTSYIKENQKEEKEAKIEKNIINLEDIKTGKETRTVVRLSPIPPNYSSFDISKLLDKYLKIESSKNQRIYKALYTPLCKIIGKNLGYCFVMMAKPKYVIDFYNTFNGIILGAKKGCNIIWSDKQGDDFLNVSEGDPTKKPIIFKDIKNE